MKKILVMLLLALISAMASAQEQKGTKAVQNMEVIVDDHKIISDKLIDGVRYISATPSAVVCSKKIDIEIKDGIIMKVAYTRGCDGNAKGIGALIKGMPVDEAVRRLEGITCGKRPTSCPDQLARILKSL